MKSADRSVNRWLWFILLLLLQMLYFPINRLASDGVMLQTPLDSLIPLLPVFSIPYLLALPWWLGSLVWAAARMPDPLYRTLVISAALTILCALLVYIFFPTYVARQPVEQRGWASDLLRFVYSNDRTYNAFPSSHTYLTTLIFLFWWRWQPRLRLLWGGILVLILLSTLFTGQHTLPDLASGVLLALVCSLAGSGISQIVGKTSSQGVNHET
jgi:membrane-associated phospholipid phosphatase